MLKDHILKYLKEYFDYDLTPGQENFLESFPDFILSPDKGEILLLKGYAGTGKTTVMKTVVRTLAKLKIRSVLLAPTGRAAKVLASITGRQAYTIHKKIYRQKSAKDGFGTFVLDKNFHSNTFFIVDEASMISNTSMDYSVFGSGKLLDDLVDFVENGNKCKLILVGDIAQLPPVGRALSPALDPTEFEFYGLGVKEFNFNEVVRQAENSGILWNATHIRGLIMTGDGDLPALRLSGFSDIYYVNGNDLIEELSNSYDEVGVEDTIVVTRSNKQANKYNAGIRSRILWREDEIAVGDLMMVVKNNYHWIDENEQVDFIANGDIFEITGIHGYTDRYNHRFADLRIRLIDYNDIELNVKVMLDVINLESASVPSEKNKVFFYAVAEDYKDVKPRKKMYEAVRENDFFNALQVKFAYAVTCHKAQGGQWKNVFVDHGYFVDDMMDKEYLRWLYTAFTRATEKLFLVNFSIKFMEDKDLL
jgi:exodeoxyribonuclease-5